MTFRAPAKAAQKLLDSDSKVTKTVEKVTFESLLPRGPIEVIHNREAKIAARQF